MRATLILLCFFMVLACGTRKEREDKVIFRNSTVLFEAFTRQTFETTYRHNEIYFTAEGKKKCLQCPENDYFGYFPADTAITQNLKFIFIDTLKRGLTLYPPTQLKSTLYLNPTVFSSADYQLIVDFLKAEYAKPESENKLLRWLNYSGQEAADTVFWNSVYAVTYADLNSLQPTFRGPNPEQWATLLVNQTLDVAGNVLNLDTQTSFFIRHDTLFYHTMEEDLVAQLKTYKSPLGKTIIDYCAAIKALDNMDRFYTPPFN